MKYLDQNVNLTDEYYGYVYLIIDKKENKVYVGQTKKRIDVEYWGSGTIIRRILKKRGNSFLKKIILGVCYSKEEILFCEYECKLFFDAFNPLYGYNIVDKDNGGDTFTNNPDKERLREQHRQNALDGKTLPKERTLEHIKNLELSSLLRRGTSTNRKNKTYEEIYGDRAEEEIKKRKDSFNTPENKKKRSEITKKQWENMSEEDKNKRIEKISNANKGKVSNRKNKSYEEIYGVERAIEEKNKRIEGNIGKHYDRKGKTYNDIYGEEKSKEVSKKISDSNLGKKRKPMSQETRNKMKGKNKGCVPWNKGLTKDQDSRLKKSEKTKEILSIKLKGNKNGLKKNKQEKDKNEFN